ncbi:MAG: hypothetical protein WD314_04785 [Trueperaceae bacterium]
MTASRANCRRSPEEALQGATMLSEAAGLDLTRRAVFEESR